MLEKVEGYILKCDKCTTTLFDYDDNCFFVSEKQAEEIAKEMEWKKVDGEWLCEICLYEDKYEDARDILVESGYCSYCNASPDEIDGNGCSRCGELIK